MPSSGGLGQFAHDVSPYLILLIFIATFGPFQFGYHLVWCPSCGNPFLHRSFTN